MSDFMAEKTDSPEAPAARPSTEVRRPGSSLSGRQVGGPVAPQPGAATPLRPGQGLAGTRWLRLALISIGGLIVLGLIVLGFGIYTFRWQKPFVTKIASVIPYPASAVGFQPIAYKTFHEDVGTLRYYYQKQQELNPTLFPLPADSQIEASILSKLARDFVTAKLAKRNGISVSSADIDAEYDKVAQQSGNPDGISENIKELYGWDIATFKQKVIRPYLLSLKLQEKISADESLNVDAKKLAEAVLARVKDGTESFEDIAKQFSQDEATAANGGDLGFFGPGEMVEPFEQAVAALAVGEVSGIVQTPYGFHIIKLVEKTAGADNTPTYKASHILIRTKTVESYVDDQLGKEKVWIFMPGVHWDASQKAVIVDVAADTNSSVNTTTNTSPINTAPAE